VREFKKTRIKKREKRKIRDRNHKQNESVMVVKEKADLRPWE
jgi:hypothetical protein